LSEISPHVQAIDLAKFQLPFCDGNSTQQHPDVQRLGAVIGEAFGIVLAAADSVVVAPIYPAREPPIPGVTAELVVNAARGAGVPVEWVGDTTDLVSTIRSLVKEGDVVMTLGAGDITKIGPQLLRSLQDNAA
jgi:UDP-N-acetylmuramate-alanine ligase